MSDSFFVLLSSFFSVLFRFAVTQSAQRANEQNGLCCHRNVRVLFEYISIYFYITMWVPAAEAAHTWSTFSRRVWRRRVFSSFSSFPFTHIRANVFQLFPPRLDWLTSAHFNSSRLVRDASARQPQPAVSLYFSRLKFQLCRFAETRNLPRRTLCAINSRV